MPQEVTETSTAKTLMTMSIFSLHDACTKFLSESLKGRGHFRETGITGRIILKFILKKLGVRCGLN